MMLRHTTQQAEAMMSKTEPLHGMYDPTRFSKVFALENGVLSFEPAILTALREQKLPYAVVNLGGDTLVWTTNEAYVKVQHLHPVDVASHQYASLVFSEKCVTALTAALAERAT